MRSAHSVGCTIAVWNTACQSQSTCLVGGSSGTWNVAGDGTGQPWQLEAIGAFCHLRLPWRHVQAILGVVEADGVFLFINAQCCKVHITNLVPFVGGSRMQ